MPSVPIAGVSPASAFVVAVYPPQEPPPAILADKIDPLTGEFESILEGRGIADAMVIEAMRVECGTGAAVRDVGHRFREVTHVESGSAEVVDSLAREALLPAEQAGVVRVERISVEENERDPSELDVYIEYRDLLAPPSAPTRRLGFPRRS